MATLNAGTKNTVLLRVGEALKVVADASGTGQVWTTRIVGAQDTLAGQLIPNKTVSLGPYDKNTSLRIECSAGVLTYEYGPDNIARSQVVSNGPRTGRFGVFVGDSLTDLAFGGDDATGRTTASTGYAAWVPYISRRRLNMTKDSRHGIPNNTSSQILARAQAIAALRPNLVINPMMTNDINSLTPAESMANARAFYDVFTPIGIPVIVPTIPPRGDVGFTSAHYGKIHQINRLLELERQTRPNLILVDWTKPYIDLATGAPKTSMSGDLLHTLTYGGYALGKPIADIINQLFPDPRASFLNRLDVYHATENPTGNLLAGSVALMEGILGTKSNGPTGDLATNLAANGVNLPAGVTVTFSKEVDADGVTWQVVTFEGSHNNTNPASFNITLPSVHASCVGGNSLQFWLDMKADAGIQNVAGFFPFLDIQYVGAPVGNQAPTDMIANNTQLLPPVAHAGLGETPLCTLTGNPTLVRPTVRVVLTKSPGGTITVAGTFKFTSAEVRKV